MDLDNLRKVWNEKQIGLPSVSDDELLSILKSKSRTALTKLYIWELIGMIIILPLIIVPLIHNKVFEIFQYSAFSQYFLTAFCIFCFFWQLYKIWILKRVDLKNNTILVSSKYICHYKLCINIEVFVSIVFVSIFMISFFYPLLKTIPPERCYFIYMIIGVWAVLTFIITWLVYVKFYRKQIRKIEYSIREIQDFEKDN